MSKEDFIPFNKPHLTGKENEYITKAVGSGQISGNGVFTKKCQNFFEKRYGFKKALMTTSCTDALEMCAMLIDIQPGDEVIVPSYTFVTSALAFVRQGAKIIFADSENISPNIDVKRIKGLITNKTKAIVVVHYGGVAVDMDIVMDIGSEYNLYVIEDAAQAIESYYKGKPLGGIGHLGAYSFHETKNVISGEGGLLIINDEKFIERAEIIWEKGTNRASFFRGEVNKYGWVDVGSSFLPSDIISAFLYAQLENLENIQKTRLEHWNQYYNGLKGLEDLGLIKLPYIPVNYASNNAHMFYIICKSLEERTELINYLKKNGILAVFHYLSLHSSKFYLKDNPKVDLPNADFYSNQLLRLPMFYSLTKIEVSKTVDLINKFYGS